MAACSATGAEEAVEQNVCFFAKIVILFRITAN
jgi:hypothetical protein